MNIKTNPHIYSVIDIGSNSIKLLIAKTRGFRVIKSLFRDSVVTRIGARMIRDGSISSSALKTSLKVIGGFIKHARRFKTHDIIIFGTQALRTAKNSDKFQKMLYDSFNVNLRIISPEEEIYLAHKGVLAWFGSRQEKIIHIDIGGGSTEIIQSASGKIISSSSIPAGCISFFSVCNCRKSVRLDNISKLYSAIKNKFSNIASFANKINFFVATGGSALQLAALYKKAQRLESDEIHKVKLTVTWIDKILKKLSGMSLNQRKRIPGMDPNRADSIIPGTMILLWLMRHFNMKTVTVSAYGIRHGAIIDYLKNQRAKSSPSL